MFMLVLDMNSILSTADVIKLSNVVGTIFADDITKAVNVDYAYNATFIGLNGKPLSKSIVSITINGNEGNFTTDENGTILIPKSAIGSNIGSYTISAYNPSTNETFVTYVDIVSRFFGNSNIVMYYYDGSAYKALVLDDDGYPVGAGEKVVVKVSGKSAVTLKTDKNGYITYKIDLLPNAKSYTIAASYKGVTVKNAIKVKQVLATKKAVAVKKSAKYFVLSATLKHGKTPIKGKKIYFKFNGKTYYGVTAKNGLAKVVIKKNVINKLKAGKTYPVKVIFAKDVIKSAVKVRR